MLEEVLRYINNRFERDHLHGIFTVEDGGLELPNAAEGQYFWVEGSVFNDGLHQYLEYGMRDEEFEGSVWLLAIPDSVLAITAEIEEWNGKNADVTQSPYQSESFGGYSYSKSQGSSEGNENPSAAWQTQFGARLRPFRKLSRDWL